MPLFYIIILIVVWAIVTLWWLLGREQIWNKLPNSLMRKYAFTPWEMRIAWGIRLSIFLILICIWINPQISIKRIEKERNIKNIILTLDISNSMKTDDIAPSRIEKAKEVIDSFLMRNQASAIGYIIFAGKSFVMSPPSMDHAGLQKLISSTTTNTIDQSQKDTSGTNIGDAIISGITTLIKSGTWQKIIILVTDGRANIGIPPTLAADEAVKNNIVIYTIGIGSSSGSVLSYMEGTVRKYFYDTAGNQILADIDEVTLKALAKKTGWQYFHAKNERLLEEVFEKIYTIVTPPERYIQVVHSKWVWVYLSLSIAALMGIHALVVSKIRRKYKCM